MESDDENDKLITLVVGGVRFTTTLGVLRSFIRSMLGTMFAEHNAQMLHPEGDGSFKIDYHCERFDWILDFLGDHSVQIFKARIASLNEGDRRQLLQDIEFFGLEDEVSYWLDELAFQPGPDMRRARSLFTTVSHGRKLFVFGGRSILEGGLSSMEILNIDTMEFSKGPSMLSKRHGCAAVKIDESHILVLGGQNGITCLNTTEVLNTDTMAFVPGPTFLTARGQPAAVAIDAHRVLIAGGMSNGHKSLSTTEVLDIRTMTFSHGPDMISPRVACCAVKLDTQRILVVGKKSFGGVSTAEILDLNAMSFKPGPTMILDVSSVVPLQGPNNTSTHFLLAGGRDSRGRATNTTEILDVNTMTLEPGPLMRMARVDCLATALNSNGANRVIVLGGCGSNRMCLSSSEVITIPNNTWAEERWE